MTLQELRNESAERLREEATNQRALIRGLRFTIGTREQAHVRDLRKAKRDLARIVTVLAERVNAKTPAPTL
jgi:ribosomal protein L29